MNWLKLLESLIAAEEAPKLPQVTEEEAIQFAAALATAEHAPIEGEPKREDWKRQHSESWDSWLRRSAESQPRRERYDG